MIVIKDICGSVRHLANNCTKQKKKKTTKYKKRKEQKAKKKNQKEFLAHCNEKMCNQLGNYKCTNKKKCQEIK